MPSTTESFDVAVAGGGVIGLACAWRAARRGLRVCLLERDEPGGGSTFAAAGMLAPVAEAGFGEQGLLALNLAAAEGWPSFAAELEEASGLGVPYERCGSLLAAFDADEAAELRRLHDFQRSLGLPAEWLTSRECRELEPGLAPACVGGVHAPHEAHVDPRALSAALVAAAGRAGAEIAAGAEVVEAVLDGDRLAGVVTADGRRVLAGHVVVATGCWGAPWLPPEARPPVRPVKGQILRLRGLSAEPLCERMVRAERVYVVPQSGGRVVIGATSEERGFDTTVTAGAVLDLLREAYRALPDVAELELVEATARLRPGTPDNRPLIGPGAVEGLVLATGHYRGGILQAPLAGEGIAALLTDGELPALLAPCSPARLHAEAAR